MEKNGGSHCDEPDVNVAGFDVEGSFVDGDPRWLVALREELRDVATVTTLCPADMPTTPATVAAMWTRGWRAD